MAIKCTCNTIQVGLSSLLFASDSLDFSVQMWPLASLFAPQAVGLKKSNLSVSQDRFCALKEEAATSSNSAQTASLLLHVHHTVDQLSCYNVAVGAVRSFCVLVYDE